MAAGLTALTGGWRRCSPLTRGLCGFAAVNILVVNLCLFFSNTPPLLRWTSLPSTLNFLRLKKMEGFGVVEVK